VAVVCALLLAYLAIMAIRAVMSWFPPPRSGSLAGQIQSIVVDLTEPVLGPVRRLVPPAGPLDLSFLLVMFVLFIVVGVVCEA
jgi:YggT family protein